ncbi:replicative DNA helicase [Sphingorhabdus soli]|uniref:Replicative DNA helicase n=1 Tax=Flavisphingopyxis soli TaxID=2601267 RepID=A0A5C6ULL4_9SPHN|nr:replicative DNA helicase [Sphingorhabdus soli]TXC73993.1 replicative DNA helicase [Sphingorhabdus soli]
MSTAVPEIVRLAAERHADSGDEVRELPHNIEAEAALIGAILIDNRVAEDLPVPLNAVHFFEPLHGRIFTQLMTLLDRNMTVTPVTLKPFFEADEAMKAVGGTGYLAQLTGSGAGLIGARDFAQQIFDLALLRELVSVGRQLVSDAMDTSESVDPRGQIEEAESALYRVSGGDMELGKVKSFAQATTEAVKIAERALNSGGHLSGITTGLTSINQKIGGLHGSDLLILAGRPGMGKTALATNIAFNAAQRFRRDEDDGIERDKNMGAKVAFFSLEMSADQLATRILAEQSGISGEALRMGKISRDDFQSLSRASQDLQTLPLFIDDTPALTIAALRTRARRLSRRHDIGLIVVDYLQLLQGSGKANDNRVNEISEISRGLKTLAKELGVPVLALSQLSRAVEQREDKRPQLSDLRESGSIEQDADIVLFVFREDYYVAAREPKRPIDSDDVKVHADHEAWALEMERVFGLAELIVAKQRHGSTGKVKMKFEPKITRFSDLVDDGYQGVTYD